MWGISRRQPVSRGARVRAVANLTLESLEERCVLTTITVGTGPGDVATIAQAAAQAKTGDTVQIQAGTYTGSSIIAQWSQSNLTIEALGGTVLLDNQDQLIPNQKGIFVIDGNNVTVQGITFQNAHDTTGISNNWAGIRGEGNTLTIQDCTFLHNDDGILTNNDPNAMTDNNTLTVTSCEFGYNGYGDGLSHNMYVGEISSFTLQSSYTHDANQGHLIKSRALNTYLLHNDIADGPTGGASSEIDIPFGGNSYLVGNVIEKDAAAGNHNFLTYNLENSLNAPAPLVYAQQLYVVNNTFVNNVGRGTFVVGNASHPPSSVLLQNNIFAGGGTLSSVSSTSTTNLATNNPGFVNPAGGDYHLASGSAAIDAGTQPGSANGFSLVPTAEYVAPLSSQPRPVVGTIDIGAYEYGTAPATPPAAPSALAAVPGDGQVSLSWTGSTAANSYNVYRGTSSGQETLLQSNVSSTSFTDSGLTDGVVYYYEVTASTAGGESGPSNEVSATPQTPQVPPMPAQSAGFDELGAYRPSDGSWSLDSNGQFGFQSGPVAGPAPLADRVILNFSPASSTLVPVSGDWTDIGTSEIGNFSNGTWHLDLNNDGVLESNETFQFGQAGDVPVPGDYLTKGQVNLAVFRSLSNGAGEFIISISTWLQEAQSGQQIGTSESFIFGAAGDRVVVGDWNGAGLTEVGVFRSAAAFGAPNAAVFSLDVANHHTFDSSAKVFIFGTFSDGVVIGDWDGSGTDKVGVYRSAMAFGAPNTAVFSLDQHGDLDFSKDGNVFLYGTPTDKYVTGRWAFTTSAAAAKPPAAALDDSTMLQALIGTPGKIDTTTRDAFFASS